MSKFDTVHTDGRRTAHPSVAAVSEAERIRRQGGGIDQVLDAMSRGELLRERQELERRLAIVDAALATLEKRDKARAAPKEAPKEWTFDQ